MAKGKLYRKLGDNNDTWRNVVLQLSIRLG